MKKSNFEFLKGVNDILYRIALAAEKNFPDDPNTTLVKLRMFGEASPNIRSFTKVVLGSSGKFFSAANAMRYRMSLTPFKNSKLDFFTVEVLLMYN